MTEKVCCAECGAAAAMPFETAYQLYYRPLVLSIRQRATAWGLSDQDVDVEALVQDAFEQALPVWHTIRVPRAWLYTVARRRLARCVPTAALRADGDPADHAERGAVSWATVAPSASAEDLVAAREVTELIQLMPQPRRQKVAYLRYLREWDFNEIAEHLGCCPATARVHALNARTHIDTIIKARTRIGTITRDSYPTGRLYRGSIVKQIAVGYVLLVLCSVFEPRFFGGWSWALAVAGGLLAVALGCWTWISWYARYPRHRRWGRRHGR